MTRSQGLLSSTARVLLAEALVIPSGVATAAYLGRRLGPEFYGLFSVATAISITLEWTVVSLFGRTTVKLIGDAADWRPVASTILRVHVAAGLIVALVFWAAADMIGTVLGDARLGPWLALLAIEVPIGACAAACRNIMTGRGNYRGRALSTGVRWLVRPLAIALFVESGLGVTGAVLGSVVAAASGLIMAAAQARVPLAARRGVPVNGLLRLAVPVFVLAVSLRLIDKLGLFATQASGASSLEAGWYAAAQNFAIAPGLFALSFSPLLLAEITRIRASSGDEETRGLIRQSLRVAVALLPLAAIGAGASREIVRLVYGPGFDAAAMLAWPLLAAAFALLLTSVATSVLIAVDRATAAANCVWPIVPATVVALAAATPRWGAAGAASVTALAVWASAVASVTMVGATLGVWPPLSTSVRSLLIACGVGALAYWWPAPGFWVIGQTVGLAALTLAAFAASGEWHDSRVANIGAPAGHDSGHYWDVIAADWHALPRRDPWRAHSDAVNLGACRRWWPAIAPGRVLKTDLFDEVAGLGLIPSLAQTSGPITAIDRSFEAARSGAQRSHARGVGADVRRLPFAGSAFDLVISNSTLDHFDDAVDIATAVAEIHRVLSPGGRLILTLDNPANPIVALRNALPFTTLRRLGLVPYFVGATMDAGGAQAMLESAGFVVRETTALMHCPRLPAIAVLRVLRRFNGHNGWLGAPLMAFERLERWPSRYRTGYFVALVADKPMA